MADPETIIRVENLGKKYIIPHAGLKRSDTFRDAAMNVFRSQVRRLQRPWQRSAKDQTREEVWATRYPEAGSVHLLEWPELLSTRHPRESGGPANQENEELGSRFRGNDESGSLPE